MTYDPRRLVRLPQWAQDHIRSLEERVARAEAQLSPSGDPHEADVYAHTHGVGVSVPLLNDPHVRFRVDPPALPDGRLMAPSEGWFDVSRRDGGLSIHGAHRMEVYPESSNLVILRLRRKL